MEIIFNQSNIPKSSPFPGTTGNSLIDNFGRPINYLRLSVTDRCNLRCVYCMPERGIKYVPRSEVLSYEEIERLIRVLAKMGITKVRITR